MTTLHRISGSALLTFVLALSAYGGDIHAPGLSAPQSGDASVAGDIHTPGASASQEADSSLVGDIHAGVAREVFELLLSLL